MLCLLDYTQYYIQHHIKFSINAAFYEFNRTDKVTCCLYIFWWYGYTRQDLCFIYKHFHSNLLVTLKDVILTSRSRSDAGLQNNWRAPGKNRISSTEHDWVMDGKKKYINIFGSFMEPFNYNKTILATANRSHIGIHGRPSKNFTRV